MSGARQGRRRRILQEEVLSASREMAAVGAPSPKKTDGGEGRRYAFDEGSLGEILAKRYFPCRLLVPVALLLTSALAVAGLSALHVYRAPVGERLGDASFAFFDATNPKSLATWLASASMLVVAVMATLVLTVRRRRVDDYRGRHRLWRGAVVMAILLSIDAATNLHTVFAEAISTATGIRLMAGGAEWWLGLGAVAIGWVAVRVLLDIKESKLAFSTAILATVAGLTAVIGPLAALGGTMAVAIASLAQVACYLLVGVALVAYMRFLRSDVAAGVATKPQKSRQSEVRLATETVAKSRSKPQSSSASDNDQGADRGQTRRKAKREKAAQQAESTNSQWTDGSDGYADSYDEQHSSRRLSKSERKRLRKQKANRRAA